VISIKQSKPMSLSPNTSISHYTVISKIGAGGMGEVSRNFALPWTMNCYF